MHTGKTRTAERLNTTNSSPGVLITKVMAQEAGWTCIADVVAEIYFFITYLGECVHTRVWCLQKPDEGVTSPEARVTSDCGC